MLKNAPSRIPHDRRLNYVVSLIHFGQGYSVSFSLKLNWGNSMSSCTGNLYCDGGNIWKNPSPFGGTWSWVFVEDGCISWRDSGIILPSDVGLPMITNNVMELYAACEAIETMAGNWKFLYCDSMVTINRLVNKRTFKGVPESLKMRVKKLRLDADTVRFVDGHPTKEQLADPERFNVSKWNVACHEECQRLAMAWIAENGGEEVMRVQTRGRQNGLCSCCRASCPECSQTSLQDRDAARKKNLLFS